MKRILLATVASVALSLPAMAAQNGIQPNNSNQAQPQSQMNLPNKTETNNMAMQPHTGQQGINDQQAMDTQSGQQRVSPHSLSRHQISMLQKALNKKGFSARRVDGYWGPHTEAAVREFQRVNHLPGHGRLNEQTLAQLGVNRANQNQANSGMNSTSGTVGYGGGHHTSMNNGITPTNKYGASSTNGMGSSTTNGSGTSSSNMNSTNSSTNGMGSSNETGTNTTNGSPSTSGSSGTNGMGSSMGSSTGSSTGSSVPSGTSGSSSGSSSK